MESTSDPAIDRNRHPIVTPGEQSPGQPGLGPGPESSGARVPSAVSPPLDRGDAWDTAFLSPWWVPSGPMRVAAAEAPTPEPGMPGPGPTPSAGGPGDGAAPVQLFVEYNATDGGAGLQVAFDGQPWTRVRIVGPSGRTLAETADPLGMRWVELTESVAEGQEPTLARLLEMFPPGDYSFRGTVLGGEPVEGTGRLSYDLPDPAVIVAIDPAVPFISWTWTPDPRSPIRELASVQVILENAREVAVSFDLPPSATSFAVPAEFLEPGMSYRVDVLAIAANGNRTVTESAFVTPRPRPGSPGR
jgi:hypothetical protein